MKDENETFKEEIENKTIQELRCLLAMGYKGEKYKIIMKTYSNKIQETLKYF